MQEQNYPVLRDPLLAGEHCSVPSCRQIDFLPFKCDCCNKVFCLEHRRYEAHKCPYAKDKVLEVVPCPLCAKGIRMRPGVDPNEEFERHLREGCDPSNYRKVHKKKKCPVEGCRERLTETGSYVCQKCGMKTCLKHRHPEDHNCQALKVNKASPIATVPQRSGNLIMDGLRALGISGQPQKLTPKPQPQSSREPSQSTNARQPQGQAERQQEQRLNRQRLPNQSSPSAQSKGGPEICPICNARFANVGQLISHVECCHQQSGRVSS